MERDIRVFTGGMNKDASDALLGNSQYRDARNVRVISSQEGNTGSLENVLGNSILDTYFWSSAVYRLYIDDSGISYPLGAAPSYTFDVILDYNGVPVSITVHNASNRIDLYRKISQEFSVSGLLTSYSSSGVFIYSKTVSASGLTYVSCTPGYSMALDTVVSAHAALRVVGHCCIHGNTYVFACPPIPDGSGQIIRVSLNDTITPTTATWDIIYNGQLDLSIDFPIRRAIPWVESNESHKIYFTDDHNYLRVVNVLEDDLFAKDAGMFDIIPDADFANIKLKTSIGGFYESGKIQYAYQYYNPGGQESLISPLSRMLHLSKSSDGQANTSDYIGSDVDVSTGKSVRLLIENLDRRYSRVKVYSVFYSELYGNPEVNVVHDAYLPDTGYLDITDTGNDNIESVPFELFNFYGNALFKCRDISSTQGYLISANITEDFFDVEFDARAYRFIKGTSLTYVSPDFTDLATWSIKEDADAINTNQVVNGYYYKRNSNIFGGTGPNVSYEFTTTQVGESSGSGYDHIFLQEHANQPWSAWIDETYSDNSGYAGYASPVNDQLRGYQRDETYRFGIVFYSKKGRPSFVHWIADIKMPAIYEVDSKVTITGTTIKDYRTFILDATLNSQSIPLGVKFDINIPQDILSDISGFEVVRAKRNPNDRSIVMQGVLGRVENNIFGHPEQYFPDYQISGFPSSTRVARFMSPDVVINQNISLESGDYMEPLGIVSGDYTNYPGTTSLAKIYKGNKVFPTFYGYAVANGSDIEGLRIIGPTNEINVINGNIQYAVGGAYSSPTNPVDRFGTSLVAQTYLTEPQFTTPPTLSTDPPEAVMPLFNYKRHVSNQYGGNTHSNRLGTEYISCGGFYKPSSTKTAYVFGGDVYITMFDMLSFMTPLFAGVGIRWESMYVPLESFINCNLRTDRGTSKYQNPADRDFMQESSGTYDLGGGVIYEQDFDLYQYNTVYSRENDGRSFFPRPYYLTNNTIARPATLLASQEKVADEISDSFCKFKPLDRLAINSNYGDIYGLYRFKNILYCFQESAVGIPSVNDRSTITDNQGKELVLGSGGILPRYDYITTSSGTRHQYSIVSSNNSLYYFDSNSKNVNVLHGEDIAISESKGMKTWFAGIGNVVYQYDNPFIGYGINAYYDRRYNEVVYTIHNDRKRDTVAFNEIFKCFTAFYDFASTMYVSTEKNQILSVSESDTGGDIMHIHNEGSPSVFYGNRYKSTLHILSNAVYGAIKTQDSISMEFESFDTDSNRLYDFFDRIRCYNNYQNTDWNDIVLNEPLTPTGKVVEADRRERIWRLHIPRNVVDKIVSSDPNIFDPINLSNPGRKFRERMRGQSLNIQFEYNNDSGYIIKIPYITTNYRASVR